MWTITSATSGRSRRIRSSISLAVGVRVVQAARAVQAERQERDQAAVRSQEAQLDAARRLSPRARSAGRAPAASASTSAASRVSVSGSRCVCTPAISGIAAWIARSSSSATSCASSSDSSPGSLRCSESSVRPSDVHQRDVVHLPHPRHRDRRRVHALPQRRVLLRFDVDDDVGVRQRTLDRLLDRVRGRVTLPDRRARRHADHDVGELRPARLPHPQTSQLDRRPHRLDRRERRRLRIGRRAVHQDVDVDLDQPRRGEQDEHADEQRRDRIALRMTRHAQRAARRVPPWSR